MASYTFVLKEPKAKRETLIFLIIREGGQRLKFSTNEKIHPSKWDAKAKRVDESLKLAPTEKAVNTQLDRYKNAFDLLDSNATIKGQPLDFEEARLYLSDTFTTKPKAEPLTFVRFARQLHETSLFTPNTRKSYLTTINTLATYETAKRKGKPLNFADITLDFYEAFVKYCNEKGLSLNTTGTHIKNVKAFADVAFEKGLHTNTAYRGKGFKIIAEDVDNIYLTEAELQMLAELDLSKNAKLDRVRDLFLIACRTGLRFSDLRNLTPDKIQGEIIQLSTKKTGQVVYIPLHHQAREILNKYAYNLPRVLSNQKFNEYVKDLAKLAGIDSTITKTKTQGGQRVEAILPKYKLVTVHTARRTFATLAYKAGVPALSIRTITGHRTERSFLAYIKLSDREHAELMAKHDFFKPQLKIAK